MQNRRDSNRRDGTRQKDINDINKEKEDKKPRRSLKPSMGLTDFFKNLKNGLFELIENVKEFMDNPNKPKNGLSVRDIIILAVVLVASILFIVLSARSRGV